MELSWNFRRLASHSPPDNAVVRAILMATRATTEQQGSEQAAAVNVDRGQLDSVRAEVGLAPRTGQEGKAAV